MAENQTDGPKIPVEKPGFGERFAAWRGYALANPLFSVTLLGAMVITLVDQASKAWIVNVLRLPELRQIELTPIFDFTYVRNFGASFGMLAGGMSSRIILSMFAITIVAIMVGWLGGVTRKLPAIGIAFIIGGAMGNLVDRVLYGYVIDFIDVSGLFSFFPWVFNVADTAINVGVGCLIVDAFTADEDSADKQTANK